MKNNNLLASVALFSELYNSETFSSIPDILAEFIKGAVVFEKKYSINSTELKELLKKTYGFEIPESVLRTTLKNRLNDVAKKEIDNYHFDKSLIEKYVEFRENVNFINGKQESIINELFQFIESKTKLGLSAKEKEKIFENFSHFLMDNGYNDEYSEVISAFVISKDQDSNFKEELGAIKEGLILYQGINYSADINQLGSWNDKLTIYLSTEHLFNCLGYNGSLYEEIFNDFSKLISEINRNYNGKTGEKLIELKYFDETLAEIDHFFKSAESIKKGYKRLDSSKIAMTTILKGCEDVNDIKEKLVNFLLDLKRKGITHQNFNFEIEDSEYNVVDLTVIDNLKKMSEGKNMPFDEEYCMTCLNIFTKINTFRRGKNNVPFEKIEHIYITENNFAKYLGHNNLVKFSDTDITFAKDIDYIISKFWFKLKKGFNDKAALPKSFDFVTKAKIILASHINTKVTNNYNKLQARYKKGEFTEEQAIELSHAYKEKPNVPELVNKENIDDSLDFLYNETYIEDFIREKTRKEIEFNEKMKEKDSLEKELLRYKQKEKEEARIKEEKEIDEARRKDEKEKEELKLKAIAKLNIDSQNYALNQWKVLKCKNIKSLLYMIFTLILTLLPVCAGLFFKLYTPFDDWLKSIGEYQILIWITLSALFLGEIFGRSYIFDKNIIKNGWDYFIVIIFFRSKTYKSKEIKNLEEKYKQNPNR